MRCRTVLCRALSCCSGFNNIIENMDAELAKFGGHIRDIIDVLDLTQKDAGLSGFSGEDRTGQDRTGLPPSLTLLLCCAVLCATVCCCDVFHLSIVFCCILCVRMTTPIDPQHSTYSLSAHHLSSCWTSCLTDTFTFSSNCDCCDGTERNVQASSHQGGTSTSCRGATNTLPPTASEGSE